MVCEFCEKEHCGDFGSGRFCSKACATKYAASKTRNHKCNFKTPPTDEPGRWKCVHCGECFRTRKLLYEHVRKEHRNPEGIWNKGLTKSTSASVAKSAATYKMHYATGLIKKRTGCKLSEETKFKISESMKRAHSEGRAHNIGSSRHNNSPSWPETWFMRVIENEFDDKCYIREYPLGIYSLDFAWEHRKKCIEIDGDQHYRFQEYMDRDKRKDTHIEASGWRVLRLPWKSVCSDPKRAISAAYNFIHEI